tara:strand:- start:6445 stop:7080 length:636 start_codon:yes stop_codon:yes gene_type:complete
MDSPEQQQKAADRFKVFCEKATAKNKEWDDFGATDAYKLVGLLEPDFNQSRIKTAAGNWKTIATPNKNGELSPSFFALNALKKLFIASLHFETPELDEGGMPTSGHSFKTRYLNAHLDRKINELKELEESTTEDGIGKKLDESLTENAKLRMRLDREEQDCDALEQECKRLAHLLENKDTMLNTMVKKSQYDMVVSENKSLTKTLNNLGIK